MHECDRIVSADGNTVYRVILAGDWYRVRRVRGFNGDWLRTRRGRPLRFRTAQSATRAATREIARASRGAA